MNFQYTSSTHNSIIRFNLSGDLLDKEHSADLIDELVEKIGHNNIYFILDLEQMNYLNSTGLNVLITMLTKVRNAGGELVICNVPKKIDQLLLITKLNTVFSVAVSFQDAVELLHKLQDENISETISDQDNES